MSRMPDPYDTAEVRAERTTLTLRLSMRWVEGEIDAEQVASGLVLA